MMQGYHCNYWLFEPKSQFNQSEIGLYEFFKEQIYLYAEGFDPHIIKYVR